MSNDFSIKRKPLAGTNVVYGASETTGLAKTTHVIPSKADAIPSIRVTVDAAGKSGGSEPYPRASERLAQTKRFIFEPIDTPVGYTPLDFRPLMLTKTALWATFTFYAINLIGLSFLAYGAHVRWHWTVRNFNYYLALRHLPAVLGVVAHVLYRSTANSLRRMLPFMSIADQNSRSATKREAVETIVISYFPYYGHDDRRVWFFFVGATLTEFLVAFKATLFTFRHNGDGSWLFSISGIATYLAISYLLLVLIIVTIAIKYGERSTGLKKDWDPTSLADMIQLFVTFDGTPTLKYPSDYRSWLRKLRASGLRYRLGYWRITNSGQSEEPIIYGIRALEAVEPAKNLDYVQHFNAQIYRQGSIDSYFIHLDSPRNFSNHRPSRPETRLMTPCEDYPDCPHYPYRTDTWGWYTAWFWLTLLIVAALVVCLAWALIRIWRFRGIVLESSGWIIQSKDVAITSHVVANTATQANHGLLLLLFLIIPITVSNLLGTTVKQLDLYWRWTQPFLSMPKDASPASQCLLLDYMTASPFSVIPQALDHGHSKVVYYGMLAVFNQLLVLITNALVNVAGSPSKLVVQISPVLACVIIIWSLVYMHAFISFLWVSPLRRHLEFLGSLHDFFCFFYDSKLRWRPEFGHAAFSPDLTKEELHALVRLTRHKYQFGVVGEPGEQHPGFDIAVSNGQETGNVGRVEPMLGYRDRTMSALRRVWHQRRLNDNGTGLDVEDDAVSMRDMNLSSSSTHYRRANGEYTSVEGHSSAVD